MVVKHSFHPKMNPKMSSRCCGHTKRFSLLTGCEVVVFENAVHVDDLNSADSKLQSTNAHF